MDKQLSLKVTGIAKDVPSNSHLDFDMIVPITWFSHKDGFNVWINNNHFVYVLLDDHTTQQQVENQFPHFMEKYLGKEMAQYSMRMDLKLTPMADIYFEAQPQHLIM